MEYYKIRRFARKLRKRQTRSEQIVWAFLRKRNFHKYRFLRQHPLLYDRINNELFFFIPDFYCAELKLIIELDGGIHKNIRKKDQMRDAILMSLGFHVLRINNDELFDIDKVKHRILSKITSLTNAKNQTHTPPYL